jgi:hypothetical protein
VKQIRAIVDSQLFTPDFCAHVLQSLVPRLLVMNADDVELWRQDPEAFSLEEDADHWNFKLRACTEKVVSVLFTTHKTGIYQPCIYRLVLGNVAMQLLSQLNTPTGALTNMQDVLVRDSLYCFAGVCAHDLNEVIQFDSWFTSVLVHDACSTQPVLRRRVAWCIGQWIGVNASKEIRGPVYQTLLTLMADPDLLVRLTAVTNLKVCISFSNYRLVSMIGISSLTRLHLISLKLSDC